jgi:hypothetical protein
LAFINVNPQGAEMLLSTTLSTDNSGDCDLTTPGKPIPNEIIANKTARLKLYPLIDCIFE